MKKTNIVQTEAVDWKLKIEEGSNKVVLNTAYYDDFVNWVNRAPSLGSPNKDLPALRLKSIEPDRLEGDMIKVNLVYEAVSPEATYPGRSPGAIKRYAMEVSTSEEPLLVNHLFKDLPDLQKQALLELMASSKTAEDFEKAVAAVTSSEGVKAIAKIRRGIEAFLNPGLVWVERYTTKRLADLDLSDILTTTNNPPGPCPSSGSLRNWLYMAGPANPLEDGEHWEIERRWMLSEKGKWDPDLYPSS
jgi:hypothetical protein